MTQQNFRVRKGLTLDGTTSGDVSIAAPAVAGTQAYTLPTGLPASNGYVLASQTDGTMSWIDNSAAGTTYTIDATSTTGGANFNLQGSDATTDTIKFASGTNVTVSRTDANTITIASTDTNTTYDFAASSTTGGANLNLTGSDSTTDTVKLTNAGHITATYTSATEVTLGSDATDANTASTIVSRDASGNFNAGTVSLAGQLISTRANNTGDGLGQIFLNGSGGNRIDWAATGTGAPAFTTRTAGTKAVLYPAISGSQVDYAIGIDSATLWTSVPVNSNSFKFKWYGADVEVASLDGTGALVLKNSLTINGSSTGGSTFTAPATGSTLSYVLPGASGAANTVLTNDGSGNLSWALPGGGGSTFGNITIAVDTDNTISTTTGDLVLNSATGTITTVAKLAVGTNANFTDWPNAQFVASQANGGDTHTYNMGVVGEAVADASDANRWGIGVYGNGFTNGAQRSGGVLGDGSVTNSADTGSAIGVRGYATDTHAGGLNIGLFGEASGGLSNYALYTNGGDWVATGAVQIATLGSNGNITLAPNGTGSVALTLANGGNLTNTRNYVLGNIRQTAAAAAGDVFGFGTGTTNPSRGLSLDNYATSTTTTGKRTGLVLRNYANAPRNGFIGEAARGTNPSSPTALTAGNNIVELVGTGYYGGGTDGWLAGVSAVGGALRINAAENWSATNAGTSFTVALTPVGAYAGTNFTALSMTSGGAAIIGDNSTFITKPASAGGTNKVMLDIYENEVYIGGRTLKINNNQTANDSVIQAYDGTARGDLTWDGTSWTFSSLAATTGNKISFQTDATSSVSTVYAVSTDGSTTATVNYNSYRRVAGNNVATKTNDRLGQFTFNGNVNTGTGGPSTNVVGGEFRVYATEDWDNTKAGTGVGIEITKQGTNTNTNVFLSNALTTEITGDSVVLQDTSGNDYLTLDSTSATFTKPIELNGSTSGSVTIAAPAVAGSQSYTLPTAYPAGNDYRLVSTTGGVTSWAPPGTGFARGSFIYTGSVTPAAANTSTILPLNTTLDSGITLDTSISGTGTITVAKTGIFSINLNVQVNNTDNGQDHIVFFWLRKNGADVPYSATDYTIIKSGYNVASLNFLQNATSGDTFECWYQVSDVALEFTTIPATTTPTAAIKPVAPSIVVNITQVG